MFRRFRKLLYISAIVRYWFTPVIWGVKHVSKRLIEPVDWKILVDIKWETTL